MPWTLTNAYCALADVHEALRLANSDTADDNRLTLAINAASRQIDNVCGRKFWQDSSATSKVYIPTTPFLVETDDFQTTVGLVVEIDPAGDGSWSVTFDAADYQLEPLNGLREAQAWAYNQIRAIRSRLFPVYGSVSYPTPYVQALVRVTAKWGWSAVPPAVAKACVLQAMRLFKADDFAMGATAATETGAVGSPLGSTMHPDALALLEPYTEDGVLVG